ncbi:MAG: biliverdin-producing heme oxygenase [Xanthobacteraceae bacterium]|jgi:heme oxygenase
MELSRPTSCVAGAHGARGAEHDGLADALRERTRLLHVRAERSGVIRDIMRGQATRYGYALLLRNLLPAYEQMERGLDRHRHAPAVGAVARREVYRARAIADDLAALCGREWSRSLPLLAAGKRYANRTAEAANGDGARLIAHAYARYLGDLSGGRILRRLLARSLALEPSALSFYDFPGIADTEAFKADYRAALDRAAVAMIDVACVVEEAAVAFRLNIAVSEAVEAAARCEEATRAGAPPG